MTLPQEGTRPGIAQEWSHILDYAQQLGFTLLREEPAAVPYLMPLFEHNALRAAGLYALPAEWRRGNLAVFSHTCQAGAPRPLPTYEEDWEEEVLLGVRVRLRRQNDATLRIHRSCHSFLGTFCHR
jgi:hypothetical protein